MWEFILYTCLSPIGKVMGPSEENIKKWEHLGLKFKDKVNLPMMVQVMVRRYIDNPLLFVTIKNIAFNPNLRRLRWQTFAEVMSHPLIGH